MASFAFLTRADTSSSSPSNFPSDVPIAAIFSKGSMDRPSSSNTTRLAPARRAAVLSPSVPIFKGFSFFLILAGAAGSSTPPSIVSLVDSPVLSPPFLTTRRSSSLPDSESDPSSSPALLRASISLFIRFSSFAAFNCFFSLSKALLTFLAFFVGSVTSDDVDGSVMTAGSGGGIARPREAENAFTSSSPSAPPLFRGNR
mmetsp:Transcript_10864/g.16546  ORF Transcript_10864/g.16546 Transcript_10864/m.16546 type:complete len:200 (-) Transcript_10864:1430-2029(-)